MKNIKKGICILVESPDGAGKDTLIANIQKTYKNMKFKIYKFPSGKFREEILNSTKPRTQKELVPLFCQDFKESIDNMINDLNSGKNIIINRMYISTLIYALENNVDEKFIYNNITNAIKNWKPDLTVILDIKPEEAFKRLNARPEESNWLDGNFDKQIRINKLYKDFFNKNWKKIYDTNKNIIQVNSDGSKEQTLENFVKQFKVWLQDKNKEEIKR